MNRILIATIVVALAATARGDATANGAAIYKSKCAMCHGAEGRGKPPLATAEVRKRSDEALAKITADGKPPKMPSYKRVLSAEEIQAVVAHIKSLK